MFDQLLADQAIPISSAGTVGRCMISLHIGCESAGLAIPWMLPRQKGSQIFPDFFEGATTTVA
jgi:hypothetical protein